MTIRQALLLTMTLMALGLFAPVTKAQTPAEQAFASGNMKLARTLATNTLTQQPNDPVALAVLSAVALAEGDVTKARAGARSAWRATPSPILRFSIAHLGARAAWADGAPLAAQVWLRRAIQMAPDTASRATTIDSLQALRKSTRLRLSFDLAVSPSDNVNGGSRDRVLSVDGRETIFVFDGSALALSGVESSVGFGLRYQITGTAEAGSELGLRLRRSAVMLSADARRLAPGARNSDYASSTLDLSFLRTLKLGEKRAARGGLTVTQIWVGGARWSQQARADAAMVFALGQTMTGRVGLAADRQWRAATLPMATALTLDGAMQRRLTSGDTLGVRLTASRTASDDKNQKNTRLAAELRYDRAASVAGAQISASLAVSSVDYPVFLSGTFGTSGREDLSVTTAVEMAFPEMGAFGFEPVVALRGSKTQSNVSRYETKALGLELRIRSSF